MQTRIIEATQKADEGPNWGKFCVARFDTEWAQPSAIGYPGLGLLDQCGWSRKHLWVLDCQTGEGAFFKPGGYAQYDLNEKHKIWVCPLFEPFLEWLYEQDLSDLNALPDLVELSGAPAALSGYRRPGPETS
jgi:hypothetical protein